MDDAQNTKKQRGRPFQKGDPRINKGGRPADLGEFRAQCREHGPKALAGLLAAIDEGGAAGVAAARVLLEYGFGKPQAAPEDNEALEKAGLTVIVQKLGGE